MSNNSIDNIVSSYEFEHKKLAYYRLVRDAAKKEIDENESDNPAASWKAKEAYAKALGWIAHFEHSIDELDKDNGINSEYIQSLCSLTPDDNKHSEERIKEVVENFISIIDSTRKAPIWLTLTADGIQPDEGDEEWYELLFKQEISPQYTLNHKVNALDKPHADLKRIASSCKIVVDDLSTRVRLTYKDSPEEPMANTYVFYWMYGDENDDKLNNKLATSRRDIRLFEKTNCMLPLGIGLTDEHGYLIKTRQMSSVYNKYQKINLDEATFEIYPGVIYDAWNPRLIAKQRDFLDQNGNQKSNGSGSEFGKELKAFRADAGNQWMNTSVYERILSGINPIEQQGSENLTPKVLTAQARILHSYISNGYFVDEQDKTLENLSVPELEELKSASTQFFYPDRKYGFFAYPVNRGNFKTKSLLKLAEGKSPVAWSGKVNEDNSTIALHCTLPEWDRRITIKLDALNLALYKTAEKVKPHAENIERLTGMSRLVKVHQKFPYGARDQEQVDIGEGLIDKVDNLAEAITGRLEIPNDEYEFLSEQDADEIFNAAVALKDLIFKEEFLLELNTYLKSDKNPEEESESCLANAGNPGPYMLKEPYWQHIIETLTQCVTSLSKTHLSDHIWDDWADPMLDFISNQPEVIEIIEELPEQEDLFAEFISIGKTLEGRADYQEEPKPVREFRDQLSESFVNIRSSIEAEEQARLDEEALGLEHQNPLLWVMSYYKSMAGPLLHNVPGSPSILSQIINLYPDKIANKMERKPSFNIKMNMALFLFCGVEKINDRLLPKSFINKLATMAYVAQSPKRTVYLDILPKIKGMDTQKLNFQIGQSLKQVDSTLSKARWYKAIMFMTTMGLNMHTLVELKRNFNNKDGYAQALDIMYAAAETLYTVSLASSLISAVSGKKIGGSLKGGSNVSKALALLGGEAAARYMGVIAVLISTRAANEQYDLGNNSSAALNLAIAINTMHVQLAYAAQKGIGRGVLTAIAEGAIKREGVVRVMQVGLASLAAPFVGEVGLFVASTIAVVMVGYEVAKGIHSVGRTSVYHMFHHYLNQIAASQIPILNGKHCHELYTGDQLPAAAHSLYEDIKNISDNSVLDSNSDYVYDRDQVKDYKFSSLSWRAVVPLYLDGFSLDSIRVMVELPVGKSELSVRRSPYSATSIVQSVEDIISYYEYMTNPNSKEKQMPGLNKRRKQDISEALRNGNFIPAEGLEEELEIMKDGRRHIISFDHLYFRKGASADGPSAAGASWEDLNRESQIITRDIRFPLYADKNLND